MSSETIPATLRGKGSPLADFELRAADGQTYSTQTARQNGLALVAFFKVGCGTCKIAAPYLQRFHEQYALPSNGRFQVWGVSQDSAGDTLAFAKENGGLTFPLLLDETLETSVRYGLTNVPDLYLLGPETTIREAIVGHFSSEGFNGLAKTIAEALGVPYTPVVRESDNAPALKPG